jgi:hypothetical protein
MSASVTLDGEAADVFLEALEELADELDREPHIGRGRPGGKLTRKEAIQELSRRYLYGELEPTEVLMHHMGTCDRCGNRSLSLEGGLCTQCL